MGADETDMRAAIRQLMTTICLGENGVDSTPEVKASPEDIVEDERKENQSMRTHSRLAAMLSTTTDHMV